MHNPSRRTSFLLRILVFGFLGATSHAFPWGDSDKLDPRDAAFAPVAIGPVKGGVQWAVPLEGGPIRVLFIAPRFALRDAAELAHRLEMRVETIPLWDATHFGRPEAFPRAIPGTSTEEMLREFLDKIDRKIDVIVAANFDFAALPPEAFAALSEKVRAGTGLVLAHHRHTLPDTLKAFLDEIAPDASGAIVTQGVGESMTAEWMNGLGFVQCGKIGEGRVVELDFQGEFPQTHCLIPALTNPLVAEREDFDTYLSLAARASRWAAGRDVAVTITRVSAKPTPGPEEAQIPPGLEDMVDANSPGGASLLHEFTLELSAPADRNYTVVTGVRRRGRNLEAPITITPKNIELRKGSQTYDFYIVAGAGDYWLDAWLLESAKPGANVVEWSSHPVKIDTWPNIADLAINKTSVLPQDTIGVTFTMPPGNRPCVAFVRATDAFGRVVAQRHHPIEPEKALVTIGLGFADLLGDILKIEVFVSDRNMPTMPEWDTRVCAYACKYLPVRQPFASDELHIIADISGSVEFNAQQFYKQFAANEIDTAAFPVAEESMRAVVSSGLHALPQVTSYLPYQSQSLTRQPCLNDPAFLLSEQTHLKGMAQIVRDYPALAIGVGEGNALSATGDDVCRCPHCVAAFGEYLRKQYADLDALEHAWGVRQDNWDNVQIPTEQQARESKRFAPWIDFRMFMDSVFVATHNFARTTLRTTDPRARSGFAASPADELFAGYDWYTLCSRLEMVAAPADKRLINIARSARSQASITAVQMPVGANSNTERWLPWFSTLHRTQAVWSPELMAGTSQVPVSVALDAMGNVVSFAPEFTAETAALRSGLAKLWLKSTPQRAAIAIYTSRSSAWLNHVDNQFAASSADAEREYVNVLSALGYAFDFISAERIAKGGLSAYRVLVLPMTRALSDAEVQAIRSFADAGGCVIADIAPAVFSEHGVPREAPPMADVFGVRYVKPSGSAEAANALVELKFAGKKASADLSDIRVDIAAEAVDAQAGGLAGMTPVWFLRDDKPALLLNHAVTTGTLARAHGALGEMLKLAGVGPVIEVKTKKSKAFHGERFSASVENTALYALLANADAPNAQKLQLQFDKRSYVYDLRARMPVLRPAKVEVELAPGAAAMYALLPYDVSACTLTVPPSHQIGTRLPLHVKLETVKGMPGDHLVHIDVYAVTTETSFPLPHYSQDLVCAKGEGTGFIPFALNDAMTRYRIVARDVLTGISSEAFVNLTGEKQV
ncbi:MAG: beta-galactosidase [Candidatus Hydrogenedentes bacterium]|nr:beta-galactosidase [Candidatus Hydrogenedentota bacterium]